MGNYILDAQGGVCQNRSRLWSLEEIVNVFDAANLLVRVHSLTSHQNALKAKRVREGAGASISDDLLTKLIEGLNTTRNLCTSAGFVDAAAKIEVSLIHLGPPCTMDVSAIETEIRNVIEAILLCAYKPRFVRISEDRIRYFEQANPFGKRVTESFPSATEDIHHASECMSVECNPATVYHLMCAAEIGLRALAKDRRVNFPKGPIELQQWGDILRELEKAIAAINQWPRTLVREAAHSFYNKALLDCRAFNNAYRRHLAHSREHSCDRDQAQSVWNHVSGFMKGLAPVISETKRTPLVWKRVYTDEPT